MYIMTNSGKLFSDELIEWLLEAVLSYINVIRQSIIIMHQMDQKLLSYLMFMTVYIGILLKLSENGL